MQEVVGWPAGEFVEEAAEWAGSTIEEAGFLCARFGLADLYDQSRELISFDPRYSSPLSTTGKAISFLAKCVADARDIDDSADVVHLSSARTKSPARAIDEGARKLPRRSAVALERYNEASLALGAGCTYKEAYAWLEGKYRLPAFATWARYVRNAKQFYRENQPAQKSA
jgi:hypothetical protein